MLSYFLLNEGLAMMVMMMVWVCGMLFMSGVKLPSLDHLVLSALTGVPAPLISASRDVVEKVKVLVSSQVRKSSLFSGLSNKYFYWMGPPYIGMFYNGASEEEYGSHTSPPEYGGHSQVSRGISDEYLSWGSEMGSESGSESSVTEGVSIHTSPFLNTLFSGLEVKSPSQSISTSPYSTPLGGTPEASGSISGSPVVPHRLSFTYKEPWDTIYSAPDSVPVSLGSFSSTSWEVVSSRPLNPSASSFSAYMESSEDVSMPLCNELEPEFIYTPNPRVTFFLGEPDSSMSSTSINMPDHEGLGYSGLWGYTPLQADYDQDSLLHPVSGSGAASQEELSGVIVEGDSDSSHSSGSVTVDMPSEGGFSVWGSLSSLLGGWWT